VLSEHLRIFGVLSFVAAFVSVNDGRPQMVFSNGRTIEENNSGYPDSKE